MLKVVYINLDRAGERRALMERQADVLGLPLSRFAAIEAQHLSDDLLDRRGRSWERPLTKPELACFLSHEALWTEAAAGTAPMVVLEDDVVLSRRFPDVLQAAERLHEVEFLNLESCDRRRYVAAAAHGLDEGFSIRRVFRDKSGSGGYLLWPSGAKKLLAKSRHGAAPVDAFLHGLRSLKSFQVEPAVAMQLHILEARGVAVPISSQTFIQTPRRTLPLKIANLPFHLRRLTTQLRLAGDQLSTFFGRSYRATEVVEAEFVEAAERARPATSDQPAAQTRS